MAVDANVLVFERLKEEMKRGKDLVKATELGFGRALPAIVDSNACTILTSLVLVNLGTGPVKGFATTLIIGVAVSLFTAVFITRSLLIWAMGTGLLSNPKLYAVNRNWFGEKFEAQADVEPLKIVQGAKRWFTLSAIFILVGVPFVLLGGLRGNVEFRGGYEAQYVVRDAEMGREQIARNLRQSGVAGASVKMGEGPQQQRLAYVTVPLEVELPQVEEQAVAQIAQYAGLQAEDSLGFTQIGPTIQAETVRNAILGVVFSCILIIMYLALRFGIAIGGFVAGLRFGFSAIATLVHDVLFVVGVSAFAGWLYGWEVSALFLTSMLTVIGYSVHDTIVIFDRIRENLRKQQPGEDFAHLVNRSVTRSFARSINTSVTVVATLLILLIWGTTTPDLKLFALTMLAGIAVGTYSSIYNAAPILYLWDRAVGRKRGEDATLVGIAKEQAAQARLMARQIQEDERTTITGSGGRTYGQVKRRDRTEAGRRSVDDE
jgi:SecD/SecF fusion protein